MTKFLVTVLAFCCAIASVNLSIHAAGVPGGYTVVTVGTNETAILTTALANSSNYAGSISIRLCYSSINSLEQQVVAGMNYKYTVSACEVSTAENGKCSSTQLSSCTPKSYVVVVFTQSWTNTIQVTSITKGSSLTSTSSGSGSHSGSKKAGDGSAGVVTTDSPSSTSEPDTVSTSSPAVPSSSPVNKQKSGASSVPNGVVLAGVVAVLSSFFSIA